MMEKFTMPEKEIPGWAEPGSNGGNWRAVSAVDYDMNVLTAQGSGKVREMDEVPAKRIFTTLKEIQ